MEIIYYRAGEMREKSYLLPNLMTSVQFLRTTWWEEKVASYKLSSDPHMYAVAYICK